MATINALALIPSRKSRRRPGGPTRAVPCLRNTGNTPGSGAARARAGSAAMGGDATRWRRRFRCLPNGTRVALEGLNRSGAHWDETTRRSCAGAGFGAAQMTHNLRASWGELSDVGVPWPAHRCRRPGGSMGSCHCKSATMSKRGADGAPRRPASAGGPAASDSVLLGQCPFDGRARRLSHRGIVVANGTQCRLKSWTGTTQPNRQLRAGPKRASES